GPAHSPHFREGRAAGVLSWRSAQSAVEGPQHTLPGLGTCLAIVAAVLRGVTLAAALLVAQTSMAADAPSRDAATRALIHRARAAFDAGDYERALERATVAYGLVPAPTLALLEARALLRLGRWLEARNRYRIAARALPPNAPRAY